MNRTVNDSMMRSNSQFSRRSEIDEFLELESKVWDGSPVAEDMTRKNSNFSIKLKKTKLSAKKKKVLKARARESGNLRRVRKENGARKSANKRKSVNIGDKSRIRKKNMRRTVHGRSKKRFAERKSKTKSSKTQDKNLDRSMRDSKSKSRIKFNGRKSDLVRRTTGSGAKKNRRRGRSKSKVLEMNPKSSYIEVDDLRNSEPMSLRGDTRDAVSEVETSKFLNFHDLDKSLFEGVRTRIEDDEESFVSIVDNNESIFGTTEKKRPAVKRRRREKPGFNLERLDKYYEDQIACVKFEFYNIEEMIKSYKDKLIGKLEEDYEKNIDYIKKKSKDREIVDLDCLAFKPEQDNIKRLEKRLDTLFSKTFKDVKITDKNQVRDTSAYLKNISSPRSRHMNKKNSRKLLKNSSTQSFKSSYKLESSKSPNIRKGLSKKSSARSKQMKQISPSLAKKVKRDHIFTGSVLQKKLNEIKKEHRDGMEDSENDSEAEEAMNSPPVMANLERNDSKRNSVDKFMLNHLSLKGNRAVFKPNRTFEPLFDLGNGKNC